MDSTYEKNQEKREKIEAWKRKTWLEFCKMVMDADKRYSLLPLVDYNTAKGASGMLSRTIRAQGVFGNMCLRRDGAMQDIYIVPNEPQLGVLIDAGSKYTQMSMTGYPSKSLVWPIIRIADDLERQYTREVTIEANKHNTPVKVEKVKVTRKRRVHVTTSNSPIVNDDSNELSTDQESNG